jgi:hypothetical protein
MVGLRNQSKNILVANAFFTFLVSYEDCREVGKFFSPPEWQNRLAISIQESPFQLQFKIAHGMSRTDSTWNTSNKKVDRYQPFDTLCWSMCNRTLFL